MTTNSTLASDRRFKKSRRFLRGALGVCLLLALAFAGGWAWLQSRPGKAWLAEQLSSRLSGVGGQSIHIAGLGGHVPFNMTADEISLSDESGPWLTVRHLHLQWSLRALLVRRQLDILEVLAEELQIDRVPTWQSSSEKRSEASPDSFPVPAILVRTAAVDRVVLGEELLGQAAVYGVKGSFEATSGLERLAGRVSCEEDGPGEAALVAEAGPRPTDGIIDLEASLTADTNSVTHQLLHAGPAGNLAATLTGSGAADGWRGEVVMEASSWGHVQAAWETEWHPEVWVKAGGEIQVTAEQIAGFPSRAAFTVSLDHQQDGRWALRPVVQGAQEPWNVEAGLIIDPAAREVDGSITASQIQLASWLEPLGIPVGGTANLKVDLGHTNDVQRLRLVGQVRDLVSRHGTAEVVRVHAFLPDVQDLGTLEAEIGIVNAQRGDLRASDLVATATGSGSPARWAGEIALDASSWGSIRAVLEAGWHSEVWMNATGEVRVTAEQIEGFPSEAGFTVSLDHQPEGHWTLQSSLHGTPDPWALSADLSLDPERRAIDGSASASLEQLSPWLAPLGVAVEGSANLQVDLIHTNDLHQGHLVGLVENLVSPYGTADVARIDARLPDVRDPGALTAVLSATHMRHGQVLASNLTVRLERANTEWDIEANARGMWHQEYVLDGTARMTLATNRQALRVDRLDVAYAGRQGGVSAPFAIHLEDGRWDLDPVRLTIDDAALSVAGHYDDASVALAASLTNLALRALPVAAAAHLPDGCIDARFEMTGRPASPTVRMDGWISDVVPEEFRVEGWTQAGVSVAASVTGGILAVEAETTRLAAGDLKAEAAMPFAFSLQPFSFAWSADRQLVASLDADMDLALLNRFGFLADQEVRGRMHADLVYDGPFKDAEAEGTFRLEQGAYHHHGFGLVLQDITADLAVRNGAVLLERCEGTDGGNGRMTATGRLELDPSAHWPFVAELRTDRATLLRQDFLTATASADLSVTGNVSVVSVKGDINIDSGEFLVDLLPPAPPPVLEVTHVGREEAASPRPDEGPGDVRPGLTLKGEMGLALTGPFFVRGAGIDSSWRGRLRLQSDGGPWLIRGSLQPRRGSCEFFGKRFVLVDSRVHFDGSSPPMPVLDVTAEYERREILARLRISGRMDDPKLALESDPDLPTDEIMARVMFGASASGLTPLQTAQLGMAVASMAREGGGESSWDLMGRTRNLLQVDELGFREDAADASSVELVAGRYVSDRLFLEFSQRIGSRESGMRAEYEINRHLSIETDAGAQMRPGIRLNVRVDY